MKRKSGLLVVGRNYYVMIEILRSSIQWLTMLLFGYNRSRTLG